MSVSKYLGIYLSSTYQPVRVNIKNILSLKFPYNYENEIFKLSIDATDNCYDIKFNHSNSLDSLNSLNSANQLYKMPYTWLSNKLIPDVYHKNLINFKIIS